MHTMLGGLELTENRRQRDVVEREALATWRADERRAALQTWADSSRVHVTATPAEAHTAILARWATARTAWADPHERIDRLLMLAHTNADVDALNHLAQQHRLAAGELDQATRYAVATGAALRLHVGDQVMTRTNNRALGVLNGQRGIVTSIDDAGRVTIERRGIGPDGPVLTHVTVPAGYVKRGGLQLAYAITAAKAQGLTSDQALVYGNGMDAHVLYPAMSRDRHRADLWLALDGLETDADRARLGIPAGEAEARQRAVDAYTASVHNDQPDGIVLAELGEAPEPIVPRRADPHAEPAEPQTAPRRDPVTDVDALAARVDALDDERLRQPTERDLLRERLQRIRLDPAGRRAADEQTRREVIAELRAIAAGDEPSGRFTREQLRDGLDAVRAQTTRRQRPAAAGRGGHVPAGAADAYVPWQRRPYGRVPTGQLADEITHAEQAAARITAAHARRQRAEQARLAEARAGRGPAMRELDQQRERLAAAVDAARQAEQHLQAARAHEDTARQARAEIRALEHSEHARSRLAKLLRPRADEVARQVRQLVDVAVRADHDAGQARAAAYPHEQLARRAPNAAQQLTELQRHWPARAAEAIRVDEKPPRTAGTLAAESFPQQRQSPEALLRRAAGLRAETTLRERLDPILARVEDLGRQTEQTRERAIRAKQQAAEHRSSPQPNRDHPPWTEHRPWRAITRDVKDARAQRRGRHAGRAGKGRATEVAPTEPVSATQG
ncbi:hypothetical protein QTQ03_29515 [Micromonospora sp. WMMA1363]|uniref:hypothetical protein n=1 Tax=Micromonospora sp. WMMA1363 TaxID=3053985 RepID=UPI00259C8542|nr:hypothetical protein [Micromonospora sp. WMMA1363]MDM4723516.1 hypothetical protein [Micromonospora sp. WMMA1363]